jgi:threonine dehydrogenase-like Zn-dependent dehydrogenase
MQQLMFEAAGEYAWREAPDPEIAAPEQAIVRPLAVACCDLDVAVG